MTKKSMKISIKIILTTLFIIAISVRYYLIPQNLFFGPEQGIDFKILREIVFDHNLTLIGSKTDISGIFHGPAYYYLAAIPFMISSGDPLVVSFFLILINSLTVIFIYYLGTFLGGKRLGIIASIIFAFSFQAIVYSRWLSSPPLGIPLVTLFFIFFYRFLKGDKKSLIYSAIALGLLNQIEFLHIIFYIAIAFSLFILYFKKIKKTNPVITLASIVIAFSITFGTYILFDLKHDNLISKSLLALIVGDQGFHVGTQGVLYQIWQEISGEFSNAIFPISRDFSSIIFVVSIILLIYQFTKNHKKYFPIALWFFIPIVLLILSGHNILNHFFVSLIPLFILITANLINFIWNRQKIIGIISLGAIVIANLFFWLQNIPSNKNIFFQTTQPELKYSDQLAAIDEIYSEAKKRPFEFQSYTIPYWSQQAWQYLFWYYGLNKYGYEPVEQKAEYLFVIIQDDPNNKSFQTDWLENTVSKWGTEESNFKHGVLKTLRLKINNYEK